MEQRIPNQDSLFPSFSSTLVSSFIILYRRHPVPADCLEGFSVRPPGIRPFASHPYARLRFPCLTAYVQDGQAPPKAAERRPITCHLRTLPAIPRRTH